MNRTDLVKAIAEKSGLTQVDAKKALDGFLAATTEALKNDDKVSLIGFGTFAVLKRTARTGRNPRTKKEIQIPAKKVVKFKAGSTLNEAL
jgi:DNA-binding protein HU-beta